jgi:hypothetical protein
VFMDTTQSMTKLMDGDTVSKDGEVIQLPVVYIRDSRVSVYRWIGLPLPASIAPLIVPHPRHGFS